MIHRQVCGSVRADDGGVYAGSAHLWIMKPAVLVEAPRQRCRAAGARRNRRAGALQVEQRRGLPAAQRPGCIARVPGFLQRAARFTGARHGTATAAWPERAR